MTHEEQIKYCRCCNHRKSTKEHGLVCTLTGAPAEFEGGCCDFDADEIAIKEFTPARKPVNMTSKEILTIALTTIFLAFMLFCYYETMSNLDFSNPRSAYLIIIALVAGLAASCWIFVKTLQEVGILKKEKPMSVKLDDIQKVLQEEGYFPYKDSDDDVTFKLRGTTLTAGTCAEGFAYTRVYYHVGKEDQMIALQAANITELSLVAIKVLINPGNECLILSVESMCPNIETYRLFLPRSLSIIAEAMDRFRYEMDKLKNEQSQVDNPAETRFVDAGNSSKASLLS